MNKDYLKCLLKQKSKHEKWKIDSSKQLEVTFYMNNTANRYAYTFPAIKYFKKHGIRLCLLIEILSNISDDLPAIDDMKQY